MIQENPKFSWKLSFSGEVNVAIRNEKTVCAGEMKYKIHVTWKGKITLNQKEEL